MENRTLSASDRLAQVEAERKKLREQVTTENRERLDKARNARNSRDSNIKEISSVLLKVQKEIFAYNKSGKIAKGQSNVLETIAELVSPQNSQVEAVEKTEDAEDVQDDEAEKTTYY